MEIKHGLKEIVQQSAVFEGYKSGQLLYSVVVENVKYTFPVELVTRSVNEEVNQILGKEPGTEMVEMSEDIGEAKFDGGYPKAITLMRYINKAIKAETIRFETIL